MAQAAGYGDSGVEIPQPTKVNEVCQKWMIHEDNCFAEQLQSDEFEQKYDLNRFNRRTVRTDIPVARVVQSEEEIRLQHERMEQLMRNQEIAQADEALAAKFREQELQEAELIRKKRALEDSIVAQQLLQEEMVKEEFQRSEVERQDEKMALELQEKERQRYELKKRERELAKERRRLEQEQQQRAADPQVMLAGYRKENLGGRQSSGGDRARMNHEVDQPDRVLRPDGRVEDIGDFSDFYVQPETHMKATEKKSLQELQDEELARLLQDQEHKRGAEINRNKLREIEDKDAELARVMQEEEKLKAQKRQQKRASKHHSSRNHSVPDQQRQAPSGEPTRDYESSLADRENHLKEHRVPLPAYQDPPAYPEGRPLPETPEYANSNAVFSTDQNSRPWSNSNSDNNEPSPPIPQGAQGNVFAAVDPTYRNVSQSNVRQSMSPQNPSPVHHTQTTNSALVSTLREENTYSNVDDMRNSGPVQAQRRSSGKRDKKSDKNGCQLQ